MGMLNYGQPVGGVTQVSYVVEDINASMLDFAERLKVGPWFVTGPFTPPKALYRGQPSQMTITLAIAFSGHMMFELIQQHNDAPSVYRELVDRTGYGFHHWGIPSHDFEGDVARYKAMGYEMAFFDISPRGVQVAYMDSTRDLPGMVELIEMTDFLEKRYTELYHASVGWDGKDPIRKG